MFVNSSAEIFPMRIELELTNDCNSYCIYCPRRFMKYKIGFMDIAIFKKMINEISKYRDRSIVLFRRGESLLHPEFIQILEYCKGKFEDIQLSTNAFLMNKSIAKVIHDCVTFISFSIELPERYKKYRLLDYDTVLRNINYFLSINKNTKTQVSIVKTDDIKQIDLEKFINQWQDKVDRIRIYEEHSKDGRFGGLPNSGGQRKPCIKPFNDILIFWDGKVGRCNHDWGEKPLCDIANQTIKEVWNSSIYNDLRKQHISLSIDDIVCKKCDSWYEQVGISKIGQVYEKNKSE